MSILIHFLESSKMHFPCVYTSMDSKCTCVGCSSQITKIGFQILGSRGESQTSTLQNRVRDVLRRGFQWKWDRESVSVNTGSKEPGWNGAFSQGRDTSSSSSQKRWQNFAPVAVQKFRRIFSSDGTHDVFPEEHSNISPKPEESTLTQCSATPDMNINLQSVADMVKMKTQDKESGENSPQELALSLPMVSAENFTLSESIHLGPKQQDVSLSPSSAISSSNLKAGFSVNTVDIESNIYCEQNLDVGEKASVKHISADCDQISDNKFIDCDLEKNESSNVAFMPDSHIKVIESSGNDMQSKTNEESSPIGKCLTRPVIIGTAEECFSEQVSKVTALEQNISNPKGSINPPIILSTMESEMTPNQASKRLLEPLYLTLDSTGAVASHTRKSPVTVQEWVDSIPLTSHL